MKKQTVASAKSIFPADTASTVRVTVDFMRPEKCDGRFIAIVRHSHLLIKGKKEQGANEIWAHSCGELLDILLELKELVVLYPNDYIIRTSSGKLAAGGAIEK